MPRSVRFERLSAAVFYAAMALLVWLVFLVVRPFLVPLGWAAIFAILIAPWQRRLAKRWGPGRAALAGTIGVMLGVVVPGILLGFYFVREGAGAAQRLQEMAATGQLDWASRAWSWVAQRLGQTDTDLRSLLQDSAGAVAAFLAGSFGDIVRNVVSFIFNLVLMLFALFFFLRDRKQIVAFVHRLLPFDEPLREKVLGDVEALIHASVTVSLFIAVIQGTLCGLAFALVGIREALFWGIVMSFLSLLPVVGAWPVWIPAAVWLFLTGEIWRGILLVAICGGVAGSVDNVLRPALLSGRSRLSGLVVFVSVLGGIAAFGMIGFVLGPVIFATAQTMLDIYAQQQKRPG
jgi:predicted PurR-regulated permease PerM